MLGKFRTCARCGEKREIIGRNLCERDYHKSLRDGTLQNYPKEYWGNDSVPVREKWEYEPVAEAELIAKQESRDAEALSALKAAMLASSRLDEATKKLIADAPNLEVVENIVKNIPRKIFPYHSDSTGFLIPD